MKEQNMLSCKEVVKIMSSEDASVWRRRFNVRFHLWICHHCRKYARHIEILKSEFKKLFSSQTDKVDDLKLREVEGKIIRRLQK